MHRTRPAGMFVPYPASVTEAEEAAWVVYEAAMNLAAEELHAAIRAGGDAYDALNTQATAAEEAIVAPVRERYEAIKARARAEYEAAVQVAVAAARKTMKR